MCRTNNSLKFLFLSLHVCLNVILCSSDAGDDNPYSLHAENYNDLLGPNYIKELSDWSTHQQTLMP